jgi:hypothetical protein
MSRSRIDKRNRQTQRQLDIEYKNLIVQEENKRQQRQHEYEQAILPVEALFELEREAMTSLKLQLELEEVDEKENQRYLCLVTQRNENRCLCEYDIVPMYLYAHLQEFKKNGITLLAYENVEFCDSKSPFMSCAHPMCSNRITFRKHHDNQIMCKSCKRKQRKVDIRERRRARKNGERQWKMDRVEAPYGYNEYLLESGSCMVVPNHRHRCRVCGIYQTFYKIYDPLHWVCRGRCERGLHLNKPIYRP